MMDWLLDTLLWTAGLIALVLLIRRPVARCFGPQIAYALWAIPALRLLMPPVELPAWLNPAPQEATPAATFADSGTAESASGDFLFTIVQPQAPAATLGRLDAAPGLLMPTTPMPILEIGISVWLVGAALFLWLRFAAYFRLRRELLEDAREVGRYGRVRLLETSGTSTPLAFGVVDPVVALPHGFMAQADITARNLALAHELSHHSARDLLANMIVQPLFALHWFNPLGRYGWLAMRRDQEAACDARVMAEKAPEERAVYASLITTFAAGPKFALAAPMACPVLGEKSIIHRLRSLKMSNMSSRRRIAGRVMVGAAVLALPLTASISYAEGTVPAAPPAPLALGAPLPPAPPAPPVPPAMLQAAAIEAIDPGASQEQLDAIEEEIELEEERIEAEVERAEELAERAEERTERARERAHERAERSRERAQRSQTRSIQIRRSVEMNGRLSDAEVEEIMVDVRLGLAEADAAMAEAHREIKLARIDIEDATTKVKMKCRSGQDEPAEVVEHNNGRKTVYLCQAKVMAKALEGLREARKALESNAEIQGNLRSQLLETLDEQIRDWERTNQS